MAFIRKSEFSVYRLFLDIMAICHTKNPKRRFSNNALFLVFVVEVGEVEED